MFGLKKSAELVQKVLRFTATGWQVHCRVLPGSLLAWLFPQVQGGHGNRYTGPGVWWPNLGRLPGRDPPVTARFQPNFSAGVWQAPHKAVFPLNELREGKRTKGFPWARTGEFWPDNVSSQQHRACTLMLFAHLTLCASCRCSKAGLPPLHFWGPCKHHQLHCRAFDLVPMPLAGLDLSGEPHSETSPAKEEGELPTGKKKS